MTIGLWRSGFGDWRRVIAPVCLAAAATGCTPHQSITVTNRTDERVHVEAQQAFVGYSMFQNPQRFRFVVEPGRTWRSEEAHKSERASFDSAAQRGVVSIRVREQDLMAPWSEVFFDAADELRVQVERDAGGQWRVVREEVAEDEGATP